MTRRLLFAFTLLAAPATAADPPAAAAVQEEMRKTIAAAESAVVALVVSHSPKYDAVDARAKPGTLGDYTPKDGRGRGRFRLLPAEADKLDLSDAKNIPQHHYGTGLVIDSAGLILTNYHVVENATKVYVRFAAGGGSYADIHAADGRSDLAVLRLIDPPKKPLVPVKFADVRVSDDVAGKATVFRGQWIVALAHPFAAGFADGVPSASWGVVSNVRRRATGYGTDDQRTGHLYQYGSLLQTDARLGLGSSGGALLNLSGEVIGLTTAVAAVVGSEAGGGYAIPLTANYRRIVDRLAAGREVEYGFLGVSPGQMSTQSGREGLVVSRVTPNTPAGRAGMRMDDVITAINGIPIRDPDDLFLYVGSALAGTRVQLTFVRVGGQVVTQSLALAKFLNAHPVIASDLPAGVHGLRVEFDSILLQQNIGGRGLPDGFSQSGVVIRDVKPDSSADAKFKALGGDLGRWMITHVNDVVVGTPAEFYAAAAKAGGRVRLTVVNPADPADGGRNSPSPNGPR